MPDTLRLATGLATPPAHSTPPLAGDKAEAGGAAELFDRQLRQALAGFTHGASPISFTTAWFDWTAHMAISPGLRAKLAFEAYLIALRGLGQASAAPDSPGAGLADRQAQRLASLHETYNLYGDWLTQAVARPVGVSRRTSDLVAFSLRQILEAWHPRNFLLSNPEALQVTKDESAANLLRGSAYFWEDMNRALKNTAHPSAHLPKGLGETIAATPGRVVYRNQLIELIHYEAMGEMVRREPVLITPAWIMKYYILDLKEQTSLVRYLVREGFDVFMISWRNPGPQDRNLGFDDYRELGVGQALQAIGDLVPGERVHVAGYCLGGTLLSVAAAAKARQGDQQIASLTLIAAQVDFADPGELAVFIDDSQLAALEAGMDGAGYLCGGQMAAAFSLLRARDLIWRRVHQDYYLGRRDEEIDLMAWNRDTTRMPYRMHSEYLRHFFLNNDFIAGRLKVDGQPVAFSDIRVPLFALGTTHDHVAPWRSVFKIHLYAHTEVTFALTNGGHNAGVVSPPEHPRRKHWITSRADLEPFVDPDRWIELAQERPGSWWPSWVGWLGEKSSGKRASHPPRRAAIASNLVDADTTLPRAPGSYLKG